MKRRTQDYLAEHPAVTDQLMKELSKKDDSNQWREKLLVGADGKSPRPLLANVITAFRDCPEWRGVLAYNNFSLRVIIVKPTPWGSPVGTKWTDVEDSRAAEWMQHQGIMTNSNVAGEAVHVVAREHEFSPIVEYLDSLKYDGKPRIERWLMRYAGVPDTRYGRAVGQRWLISAIARARKPGCQVDCALVLEGPQGIKKSTMLRELAGTEYFTDHLSSLDNKDSRQELHGVWIVELGELASVKNFESEKVKSFLSARDDYFRPSYGRRAERFPRTNIFAGSTNNETSLKDETGARRYWPVACGMLDIDRLVRDRDQLWAEADLRYREGAVWWLETDELNQLAAVEQAARYEPGVWDDAILAWIAKPKQALEQDGSMRPIEPFTSIPGRISLQEILLHGIHKSLDKLTPRDQAIVAKCLVHNGWKRKRAPRIPDSPRPWFYLSEEACRRYERGGEWPE